MRPLELDRSMQLKKRMRENAEGVSFGTGPSATQQFPADVLTANNPMTSFMAVWQTNTPSSVDKSKRKYRKREKDVVTEFQKKVNVS
jgi:hypothetical protein